MVIFQFAMLVYQRVNSAGVLKEFLTCANMLSHKWGPPELQSHRASQGCPIKTCELRYPGQYKNDQQHLTVAIKVGPLVAHWGHGNWPCFEYTNTVSIYNIYIHNYRYMAICLSWGSVIPATLSWLSSPRELGLGKWILVGLRTH